ncbi:MAG: S41 family peptidase [Myxococcota bacterium]
MTKGLARHDEPARPRFPMLLLTATLTSVLSLGPTAAPANVSAEMLTVDAVRADVAVAREAYERVHPGYDRYTKRATLDAAWEDIVDDAESDGGMTLGTFYLRLQATLALIRCNHTKAELSPAQVERRETNPLYLPAAWEVVDGRAFVLAATDPALRPRDELLAIDGVTIPELITRYGELSPIDGFTEHAREREYGSSSEFRGGVLEHFRIETENVPATAVLTVQTGDAPPREVSVDRVDLDAWKEAQALVQPFQLDFRDAVTFEPLGDDAGYLRVDTFVNYRNTVRPDRIYDPIFKQLRRDDRSTLILDLRNNGGGSADALNRLYAHLMPRGRAARLVREIRMVTNNLDGLRDYLWTWSKRALNPKRWWFRTNDDGTYTLRPILATTTRRIRPDRWAFRGRIIVLTSHANASAVSTLMAKLSDQDNVTVVGEPTGGSAEGVTANILYFLRLPNSKITGRLPAQRIYNDVETFTPGMGVSPDVEILRTADDVRTGRDRALEHALSLAGQAPDALSQ